MNSLRALNETMKWYRTFVRLTKSLSSCSEDTNNPCGFVFISILILPEFITDSINGTESESHQDWHQKHQCLFS